MSILARMLGLGDVLTIHRDVVSAEHRIHQLERQIDFFQQWVRNLDTAVAAIDAAREAPTPKEEEEQVTAAMNGFHTSAADILKQIQAAKTPFPINPKDFV